VWRVYGGWRRETRFFLNGGTPRSKPTAQIPLLTSARPAGDWAVVEKFSLCEGEEQRDFSLRPSRLRINKPTRLQEQT
jgi:hypothetical protein